MGPCFRRDDPVSYPLFPLAAGLNISDLDGVRELFDDGGFSIRRRRVLAKFALDVSRQKSGFSATGI